MIRSLKRILEDSGCTLVIYESQVLANLLTDLGDQKSVIGLIHQPNDVRLEVKANAIIEHYNPLMIEIMKQVKLEDFADTNQPVFEKLLSICKEVIVRIIKSGIFDKIGMVICDKIPERKYDANTIGWAMRIDLTRLENRENIPC